MNEAKEEKNLKNHLLKVIIHSFNTSSEKFFAYMRQMC